MMNRHHLAIVVATIVPAVQVLADELKIDTARSRIQVDAHATGHDFTGTLDRYDARASGDPSSLKARSFELSWRFSDLHTADGKRDGEMLKWLEDASPEGSFRFTKSWTDEAGGLHGMGRLSIHGVTKDVSFPYSVKKDGEWVTIDGQASLDYRDFKLPLIRAMAVMTVDPQLTVRFHVVGRIR